MSVLENLFSSLTGGSSQEAEHPCSNCPSDCAIAGEACSVCRPNKEKLVDAIYRVEHADEIRARYVVSPSGAPSGTTTCPFCGAPSADRKVCEYCGMQIGEEDEKIYVTSASEIPNPILEARDIIYDRYEAVGSRYTKLGDTSLYSAQKSGGLLSGLLNLLSGGDSEGLGNKMTEAEILEAAGLYGVTAARYLSGLDNGIYLPLGEKKKADQQSVYVAGMSSAAGAGLGYSANRPPAQGRPPRGRPPEPPRRPASPSARRSGEPRFEEANGRRGRSGTAMPEPPGRPGARDYGSARQRQPAPPFGPVGNDRSGSARQKPASPSARPGGNDRSGTPKQKPAAQPSRPGGNVRSGSPKRRPEGPPSRPGGSDRGGGHQR